MSVSYLINTFYSFSPRCYKTQKGSKYHHHFNIPCDYSSIFSLIPMSYNFSSPIAITKECQILIYLFRESKEGTNQKLIYLAMGWQEMYSTASSMLVILSASASGISMANSSSMAITTSTESSESRPRSSANLEDV